MKKFKDFIEEYTLDAITEQEILEAEVLVEKNVPTSPEKWAKAKSAAKAKFAVYPSAYANGWAAKKYKSMGGGWKSVSEDFETPEQQFDLIEKMVEHLSVQYDIDSEVVWEQLDNYTDEELIEACYSFKEDSDLEEAATPYWKKSSFIKRMSQMAKKERLERERKEAEKNKPIKEDAKGHKNPTGGLTQKGRDYYNNKFGGNLQAPVTTPPSKLKPGSRAANRRKSFCARMSGVKGPMKKPNGEPSRKALALRKWNC